MCLEILLCNNSDIDTRDERVNTKSRLFAFRRRNVDQEMSCVSSATEIARNRCDKDVMNPLVIVISLYD